MSKRMSDIIPIRDSVGFNLIRTVFSVYIVVAVIVTMVHMGIEYSNTKSSIKDDLQLYQTTFESPLATALWDLDEQGIALIVPSILTLPSVVGVKIEDIDGFSVSLKGTTSNETNNDRFIIHNFPVFYTEEGENTQVGNAYFYSTNDVVLNKVKTGFILIIVNSIIKTTALWIIFLIVVKPLILVPIEKLSKAAQKINLQNIGNNPINIKTKKRNELKVLAESFNVMASNIKTSTTELNKTNDDLNLLINTIQQLTTASNRHQLFNNAISALFTKLSDNQWTSFNFCYQDVENDEAGFSYYHHKFDDNYLMPSLLATECSKEFNLDQPSTFKEGLGQFELFGSEQSNKLLLPIWHGENLLAVINICAKNEFNLSEAQKRFIESLINFLMINMEELLTRMGLESAVVIRTAQIQKMSNELRKKAQDLETSSAYKSQFIANMSHEIRTPMNAIIGFSDRGIDEQSIDTNKEYFKKIHRASKSLLVIINDILDFSKVDAGKLELNPVEFNLNDMIESVISIIENAVNQQEVKLFVLSPSPNNSQVIGDPDRLQQVLINIINNAVKFTEKGYISLSITDSQDNNTDNNDVLYDFIIEDTGIGIDSKKCDTLFEAFSQADLTTTRNYGGTGLGLTISKKLVELMNGNLIVKSELGKGSTFSFQLRLPKSNSVLESNILQKLNITTFFENEMEYKTINRLLALYGVNESRLRNLSIENINNSAEYLLIDGEQNQKELVDNLKDLPKTIKEKTIISLANNHKPTKDKLHDNGFKRIIQKPILANSLIKIIKQDENPEQRPAHWWIDGRFKALTVLIVEDNLMNQMLLEAILEDAKMSVTIVDNGLKAVEAVKNNDFDMVFMDIQMPEMDGLSATKEIRTFNQSLPILAMTAHASQKDKDKSLAAGMNSHITKPIDPDILFNEIERFS